MESLRKNLAKILLHLGIGIKIASVYAHNYFIFQSVSAKTVYFGGIGLGLILILFPLYFFGIKAKDAVIFFWLCFEVYRMINKFALSAESNHNFVYCLASFYIASIIYEWNEHRRK